jgi:hypothetical protein
MRDELVASRHIIHQVVLRDLKGAYRKSYLGYLWAVIPGLTTTAIWMFLNSQNIIKVEAQLHYEEARSVEWQERAYSKTNPYDGSSIINQEAEFRQGFRCYWESGGACTSILSTHSPAS